MNLLQTSNILNKNTQTQAIKTYIMCCNFLTEFLPRVSRPHRRIKQKQFHNAMPDITKHLATTLMYAHLKLFSYIITHTFLLSSSVQLRSRRGLCVDSVVVSFVNVCCVVQYHYFWTPELWHTGKTWEILPRNPIRLSCMEIDACDEKSYTYFCVCGNRMRNKKLVNECELLN